MTVESSAVLFPALLDFWLILRVGALALMSLYFIFSLIVLRQINLMSEVVISEASPILKAFAIVHAGLALGVIILFIGFLFA